MWEFGNFDTKYNRFTSEPTFIPEKLPSNIISDVPKNNSSLHEDKLSLNNLGNKSIPNLSFTDENFSIEHKIKRGESLSDISEKYFGKSDKYMDIFNANKDKLRNPNDLTIGMILNIPTSSENIKEFQEINPTEPIENPISINQNTQYKEITVKKGQSLSILSLKYLKDSEKYMDIFDANRDILKTPDSLKPGMKLRIPINNEKKSSSNEKDLTPVSNEVIDAGEMNLGAKGIYDALKRYQDYHIKAGNTQRAKTTEKELRLISVELDKASKAFDVDPKIMLAVFAHESGGFNPRATSHTGAGGLGQLTGIAIKQVHYMAGMVKGQQGRSPFTEYKDNFIKSQTNLKQRHDIKSNIWTSTAYMAYEIKDRNGGNIKRSLERYGDPNVSTYENKVSHEYKIMFGKSIF